MIIYDQARLGGWDIIFHSTGSALYSKKSIIPALFSALAAGIISNVPEVLDYHEEGQAGSPTRGQVKQKRRDGRGHRWDSESKT